MLEPPFLELQYYVGKANVGSAVSLLVDGVARDVVPRKLVVPAAVGLLDKPEEVEVIGGVVVLRTEGEVFCGPERQDRHRIRKQGRQVYERFVHVADLVEPVYAAILVEYSLEEPKALRQDPRSLAFRDFYIGEGRLGRQTLDDILLVAGRDVYIEKRGAGVYISMSAEFNPTGRGLPALSAQERSVRISAILGRVA